MAGEGVPIGGLTGSYQSIIKYQVVLPARARGEHGGEGETMGGDGSTNGELIDEWREQQMGASVEALGSMGELAGLYIQD